MMRYMAIQAIKRTRGGWAASTRPSRREGLRNANEIDVYYGLEPAADAEACADAGIGGAVCRSTPGARWRTQTRTI